MEGEWETASLGELCDFRAGSVFKPDLQGRTSGEFPFVKVSDMNLPANAVRIQDANNWVSAADLCELRAKPFPPGTVVFAKIGEALRQNRLRQVARETIIDNNMMGAVPRINRVEPRFFYYALSRFDFSDIAQGTALPYLTVGSLTALTLNVPPPAEQRAIAHILGTLDDKIELNRRRNQTLEAMARALFKDWFVDFGPVRAKGRGGFQTRPYDYPPHILDLFPDRLDDDGKPAGWEVAELGDVTTELRRGISPSYLESGGVRVLNQKCIRNREINFAFARRHDDSKRKIHDRTAMAGDILVNSTGVGTLGRTAQLWKIDEPTVVDSHVSVVRPNIDIVSSCYLGLNLTGREAEIEMLGEGSTGQTELSRVRLGSLPVLVPPRSVLNQFDTNARPLVDVIVANTEENTTLAQLRDTLLPKLISGDLRIADAHRFLERVA